MSKRTLKDWMLESDLKVLESIPEDFEFSMARGELKTIKRSAERIMKHLDGAGDLEAWVQSKITKANDYLNSVANHMDGGEDDTEKKKEVKEGKKSKCDCDCGQDPCVKCGESHHDIKEGKESKEAKKCPDGKYWCMTDKKCKKIPKGWHMMRSGLIMKDEEHEEEGKKNGNGNGEGSESNGGGVSEGNDFLHAGNPNPQMRNMPMGTRNAEKLANAYGPNIKKQLIHGLHSLHKARESAKKTKLMKSDSVRVAEGCGSTHETKKKKKKLSEMISTSMSGKRYRNVDNREDQEQIEKENRKKKEAKAEESKKRKAELADLRVTKGIRFYDKKGSGYIKDGKKVYDESVNLDEKCWKGYEKKGMKTMFGKRYPNCVKKEEYSDWRSELEEANKSGDNSLRDWFSKSRSSDGTPGWVQLGGKYAGKPCAKQPGQTTKPKCGSSKMKRDLNKDEEERAFRRKNAKDPNPDRKGKAINVKTEETILERGDFWHPDPDKDRKLGGPGANQRAREDRGAKAGTRGTSSNDKKLRPGESYMQYAKRMKNRRESVEIEEGKKDACYHKVKSRYSVWPSAYASGALVKCRKAGAKNWGNKSKKEEFEGRKTYQQFVDECWKTHKKVGMKMKGGKLVPDCRPKNEEVTNEAAAWTRKAGKNKEGGLNEKGRKSYERENPGSDLKAPSKKVGNPRRASFCARMKGMKSKLTSKKTANDPDSRINKSLRAWNC